MGDLRAIAREIILRILKRATEEPLPDEASTTGLSEITGNLSNQFAFMNNKLSVIGKNTNSKASLNPNMNAELAGLFKTIIENEDAFYIKMFNNGQELTSLNHSSKSSFILALNIGRGNFKCK